MEFEDVSEATFLLRGHAAFTYQELRSLCAVSDEDLAGLIDFGVLEPVGEKGGEPLFSSHAVVLVRKAARLKADFELDPAGVSLALAFLERVEALEAQMRELQARLLSHE
jgi:chaperone modulatory protein CbpM